MRRTRADPQAILDRSIKALIRRVPPAALKLIGADPGTMPVRPADVSVNLPEFRADQVFLIGEESAARRWALHLEYQVRPDPRVLRGWFLKNAGLTAQLERPVILVALYLRRARRATFPSEYSARSGALETSFRFHTIRLWEEAARIRSRRAGRACSPPGSVRR